MDFDLTDEQRLLRDTVRDFADQEVAPVAEELDRTKSFPYEIVAKLGELGLMGIPFPEEYGGGGADTLSYALAVEELARVDSSVGITRGRPHLARDDADPPLGHRRAEARVAARAVRRPPARRVRADRARGGLRRRRHPHHGRARRRRVGDQRRQAVHHQLGHRHHGCVTITAVTGARERRDARSRTSSSPTAPRLRGRRGLPEDGLERVRHAAAHLRRLPRARGEPAGPPRRGLQAVPAHPRRRPDRRRRDGRWGWPRARSTRRSPTRRSAGRSASRSRSSRRSRRRSPTSRPRSRPRGCSPTRRR